jgi:hypothetical protein
MALHKIIEHASEDPLLDDDEDYNALPINDEDDDFDMADEVMFQDHDVRMLFETGPVEQFALSQVSAAPFAAQCHCFPSDDAASRCSRRQHAERIMRTANLHPSAWFLAFKRARAADHVLPPPPPPPPPRALAAPAAAISSAHPRRAAAAASASAAVETRAGRRIGGGEGPPPAHRRRRAASAAGAASEEEDGEEPAPKRPAGRR